MWSCGSDKSPSPYGFNFGFIKFYWEEIKADIIRAVHSFEEEGRWPRGTNASIISLIPKDENPQRVNDFRLISLVGCLYKIVANILSLRLKKVLYKVMLKMVVAPSRHVFDEDFYVQFMYISFFFKNVLGSV